MLVRRAEENDCEGICAVHVSAVRELCSSAYSPAEIDAWIGKNKPSSYVAPIRDRQMFVATEPEAIVGFGQLNANTGELEALYVDPRVVRTGVGRVLVERLEEVARACGIESLFLNSSVNAVAFYESLGYRTKGKGTHRLRNGSEITCVKMEKRLVAHATPPEVLGNR